MRAVLFVLTAVLLATADAPAAAQENDRATRVWLGGGIGPGGASDGAGGAAGMLYLSVLHAPHQLTLRLVGTTTIYYAGRDASEVSVVYGRAYRGRSGHLSIGSGLGMTSRVECSGCDARKAVALPLSAEAALRLLPVLGLGVHVFANLSELGYMGGVVLFAQVGWLPR